MAPSLRINIPPLTRVLLVLNIGISLIYQAARYRFISQAPPSAQQVIPWVALIPGKVLTHPWVLITSSFAELNILTLIIAATTLLYGGRYLERAWGSSEFAQFLLVVALLPNIIATIIFLVYAGVTANGSHEFARIQGSIAVQASFLVAFKQLVPEHTVTILKGVIKTRVKHFPAVFLAANTISGLFFGTGTSSLLAWLGFMTSWTYLRFYKRQPDLSGTGTAVNTLRGDASETFAFAYFWPDVVHGPIAAISDGMFDFLVAVKICTPFSAEEVESSNVQASARGAEGLPSIMNQGGRQGGGKREEAERRRALALKALDQRLQAATASRQASASTAQPAMQVAEPLGPSVESKSGGEV